MKLRRVFCGGVSWIEDSKCSGGGYPLSHHLHKRAVVLRMDDTCVHLRRVVVGFMRKNRHNIGFRAVFMEVLGQCASPCTIELVTEQEDSAPAKADLEQSGYDCLYGKDLTSYSREHLGSGFC